MIFVAGYLNDIFSTKDNVAHFGGGILISLISLEVNAVIPVILELCTPLPVSSSPHPLTPLK